MKKNTVLKLILLLACVLGFCSCDSKETGVLIQNEVIVAAAESSEGNVAAIEYCEENGYKYNLYNDLYDASLAVSNGKADYVVISEYEYNKSNFLKDTLTFHEKAGYSVKFHGITRKNNDDLCEEINSAIKVLRDNGELEKVKKNFIVNGTAPENKVHGKYKGTIKVLCLPDFENKVFYDESGKLNGTDVALAYAICNYLGYELEFVECQADDIFYKLEKGEGDIIFSSMEYTPQRAEQYLYTDYYDEDIFNVYKRK